MATSKEQKIISMLRKFDGEMDSQRGAVLINDFMQLSKILEFLKDTDKDAFIAFYTLIEKNLELETLVKERGTRISKLQKGQTQPKDTGSKTISTHRDRNTNQVDEFKDYRNKDISGQDMHKANLFKARFDSCNLKNINFRACKAVLVSFIEADLTGANFTGAKLDKANFSKANLENGNFTLPKLQVLILKVQILKVRFSQPQIINLLKV